MASEKIKAIRERVKSIRRGIPLDYKEQIGLKLLVIHPPLGVCQEWDEDTDNSEVIKNCVATEDGSELIYFDATDKELAEIPMNVVQDIAKTVSKMLNPDAQEHVVGNSNSDSETEKPSTESVQPTG